MILELNVAGNIIRTTAEHPFYVADKGWTPAGELAAGDKLATLDGQYVPVTSVRATEEFTQVYNFRIADHHTYFVGDETWAFAVW
jgi:intein/homing endonuclease